MTPSMSSQACGRSAKASRTIRFSAEHVVSAASGANAKEDARSGERRHGARHRVRGVDRRSVPRGRIAGSRPPRREDSRAPPVKGSLLLAERTPHLWSDFNAQAMIDWWDWAPTARIVQEAAPWLARPDSRTSGLEIWRFQIEDFRLKIWKPYPPHPPDQARDVLTEATSSSMACRGRQISDFICPLVLRSAVARRTSDGPLLPHTQLNHSCKNEGHH